MAKKDKAKGGAKGNKEEVEVYKVSWFDRIPYWIKAVFVKWWFYGMIYFFFVMGLGGLVGTTSYTWDIQLVVLCFVYGLFVDIFVNNILLVVENRPKQAKWWYLCKGKKFYWFLINVVFGVVVALCSSFLCAYFTTLIDATKTDGTATYWFREPCSFALVSLIFDLAIVGIKDLVVYLVNRSKAAPKQEGLIDEN